LIQVLSYIHALRLFVSTFVSSFRHERISTVRYRWPFGPPSPAQPRHDAAQARSGPARRGPTDFVLVLGGTMG
jgi:hypothetical protein